MFFIPVDHPHVMLAGRSLLNLLIPAHNRLEGAPSNPRLILSHVAGWCSMDPVQANIPDEPPLELGTISYGRMFFIPVDHPHVMPAGRSLLNRFIPAHNRLEGAPSNPRLFLSQWQVGVPWTLSMQ